MVERNRGMVVVVAREGASDLRKERDRTSRVLPDVLAFCDENVGGGEPGRDGLPWSDIQVFFNARLIPTRNHPQDRAIPHAVDPIEILVAPSSRVHIRWGNGHTYGLAERGKENWSGAGGKHREHDVVAIASGVTDRENGTVAAHHSTPLRKCADDGARGVVD